LPRKPRVKASPDAPVPASSEIQLPSGELVPIPFASLTDREKAYVKSLQRALSATKPQFNPMWDDEEELGLMASVGRSTRSGNAEEISRFLAFQASPIPTGNISINDRFSKRYTVADMNIPRNPDAVITLSLRYALENPFVAKAAKVKTDFVCSKFEHKTHNDAARKFYDGMVVKFRLKTMLRKIVWNMVTVGICPIYWGGEDGGAINFMQVLSPTSCHYLEVLGQQKVFLKITQPMVEAVLDPTGEKRSQNKAQFESMPKYWVDKIQQMLSKGEVLGSIELMEGSYTVLENNYASMQRNSNVLDGVPLQGAFDALQRYRLFAAGDFAVAWNVKNMLTLISEGDPKQDGKDYTPADTVRLQNLQSQFAHPDYALTLFCDPTTQVRYVVPPLEVFKQEKYAQCEKEIKEILNLPSFMWNNDGSSTFGAAVAEVELLRKEIEALRMLLEEQFFMPFYTRLRQGARRPGFAITDIPMPTFDQNSLHDPTTWLTACADLYSRGAISLESLMGVFGLDFEYEMEQKKEEHEKYGNTSTGEPGQPVNNSPARPLFEPSQGNLAPTRDKGGNEGDGNGNPDDTSRTPRRPRASSK
jgi:hypothetical protein